MGGVERTFPGTSAVASVMEVLMRNQSRWVSISLKDGEHYEGTIESEVAYGIYMHLNGVIDTLRLLTWDTVEKVEYINAN